MATRHSGPNMPIRYIPLKSIGQASYSLRLAQVYQVARPATAVELYRRSCQRVAEGNDVLLAFGKLDMLVENMACIEASLASRNLPELPVALHEAEMSDCLEQPVDELFRERLRQGKATIAEAKDYIRRSAAARHKAEQAERAVADWIKEQDKAEVR